MEQNQLSDLVLDGVNTATGGNYNVVTIEGVGKVNGSIFTRTFKGNGSIKLNADITAQEMECNGTLDVKGNVHVHTLKVDGILTVDGKFSGENCTLAGLLKVKGDCELERFSGHGVFSVGGLLSAGIVEFKLEGRGKAKEIGVESIVIRQKNVGVWSKWMGGIIPILKQELHADVIEGDYIDLTYTTADIVRGNVVIIGEGCVIGVVEYRSTLTKHPDASIVKEVKVSE